MSSRACRRPTLLLDVDGVLCPCGWAPEALGLTGPLAAVAFAPGVVVDADAIAWVDDAFDARCQAWAAQRPGPTHLERTDAAVGLTDAGVRRLLDFAEHAAARGLTSTGRAQRLGSRPVIREILPPDTGLAFEAIKALRPSVTDEASFVQHVDEELRGQGYRLIGAFDEEAGPAPTAVSGFRVSHNFAFGHYLYVEDTSTLPAARGKGHARGLLDWLAEEAQRLGCAGMHLSSGVGENRASAHRLYFNAGLRITAFHFAKTLD